MSQLVRRLLSALILLGVVSSTAAYAQSAVQADRIAAHPNLRATTRIAGHVPSWAIQANDAGPVSPDTSLRLTFVLSRSPERQAAFTQLLADLQNPASPSYHHWLTPQQIGTRFGPTQHDLDTLTAWLSSQGLPVKEIAPSRIFVTTEAPVSAVANALGTSFRYFNVAAPAGQIAKARLAATTAPAIPTALAAIVTAIDGLADIPVYPMHHSSATPVPLGTSASTGTHYITPADFAVLYDLNPVYQSGINGANQKIAIMGRSRVDSGDISIFEKVTNLATKQPNIIVAPAGVDPGTTNTIDQDEATFDVDRVLGTAPGAQADLVIANAASGGIQTAAQYEVQTLLDPIMSISFGSCETNAGQSGITFWDTLFSQAAAEGISVFVSSGDAGAAACQSGNAPPSGTQARSINVICASSFATCVGGTQFADIASPATYWKPTNGTGLETAISYIPEGAWNEPTAISGSITTFVDSATGGGASAFITKPVWQIGTGVPADGFRDVPDVSFSTSIHNGYLICEGYKGQDCVNVIGLISGTSGSAPAMAGIAAILNQKTGGAQGNLNPFLYRLAASTPAAFHDATPATSGSSCDINTPSVCNNSTPSPTGLTGGLAGFALTTGYDQATGLGSLDVSNIVSAFTGAETISVSPASSSLTLAAGAIAGNTDLLTINSTVFAGSLSLGCTVTYNGTGTPASSPICSISPGTVTIPANGSVTSTLTLATSARSTAALAPKPSPRSTATFARFTLASLFLLPLLATKRVRRSLRTWSALSTGILLLAALGTLSACSGSSTPISPNPLLISSTNTAIAVSTPTIFAGASDTFSATVVNAGFNTAVAPTGSVRFFVNGGSTPAATAALSGTTATASIPFPTTGTYNVVAVYSGDNNFTASTSAAGSVAVIPTGTTAGSYTVTITAAAANGPTATSTVALTIQ
ncbi:protease pro-enzyme activation domain-containing protein [Granulicella arctica]|uniref:protease pro-enzyme activation domain-containing protein n=1 Tax=Granulicella arctica TaxID=940613 RepID=UPI0021E0BBC2|nr:protease pro-enzyme activation domain-containing protein [Granulicella arctica]